MSLDAATNIAVVVVIVFLLGGLVAAWLMKTIVQKLVVVAVLALLAFSVWSQRASLQECADRVRTNLELDGAASSLVDTDCNFFGLDITISDPRNTGDE